MDEVEVDVDVTQRGPDPCDTPRYCSPLPTPINEMSTSDT